MISLTEIITFRYVFGIIFVTSVFLNMSGRSLAPVLILDLTIKESILVDTAWYPHVRDYFLDFFKLLAIREVGPVRADLPDSFEIENSLLQ